MRREGARNQEITHCGDVVAEDTAYHKNQGKRLQGANRKAVPMRGKVTRRRSP